MWFWFLIFLASFSVEASFTDDNFALRYAAKYSKVERSSLPPTLSFQECFVCFENVPCTEYVTCCRNGHEMHASCLLAIHLSRNKACPICRDQFIVSNTELILQLSHFIRAEADDVLFTRHSNYLLGLLKVAEMNRSLKWIRDSIHENLSVRSFILCGQVKFLRFAKKIGLLKEPSSSLLLLAMQESFRNKNNLARAEIVLMLVKLNEPILLETFPIRTLQLPVESKFLSSQVDFAQLAVIFHCFEVFVACLQNNSRIDRQALLFLTLMHSNSLEIKFLEFLLDFDPYLDLISPSSVARMTPLQLAFSRSKDAFLTLLSHIGSFKSLEHEEKFRLKLEAGDIDTSHNFSNYIDFDKEHFKPGIITYLQKLLL